MIEQPDMTGAEARAEVIAIQREIGPKAEIYVSLNRHADGLDFNASIYATGITSSAGVTFRAEADTLRDLVAAIRGGWAEYGAEYQRRTVLDMALEIIRLTDEAGECTDAALRGSRFNAGDVARFGTEACAKANEMAGRGPFSIRAINGANAMAA